MCLALVPRPWNGLKRRFALIRYFPIKPIHLAFLLLLLYFLIFSWTMAGLGLFVFALFNLVRNYPLKKVFQSLLCLALFAAYFGFIQYKSERDMAAAPASLSQIQMIPDTISVNGDLLSFEGKSDGQTYQVFYKLKSQKEQGYFQKLDKSLLLKVKASTEESTAQLNFKGFDYRNFLRRKGIYRIARIEVLESLEEIKGLTFFELLQDWRRKAILYCQENFPAPMQHYMTGLLFGYLDKSFEDMTELYSSLGIIHLFALSGMHVTFFLGLFRFVCLRIGLRLHVVDGLQLVFSVFYAGLTGFSVSVLRSLVQSSLATRGIKRLDNLAITVLILSIIRPNFLLTTGGVLSFSYAFVLALTSFEDLSRYARVLVESLALSLGVLPILIFYFSVYQPLSILLTAAFSLLFDLLVLPILTLAFCLSPVVKLSFFNGLFLAMEKVLIWTSNLVDKPLVFGMPNLGILLLLLLLLGFLYDCYSRKKLALVLSLIIALLFFLTKNPPSNEVTVVDIGQGDSIFLRDVRGKTVLIDVGGRIKFGQEAQWQERVSDANAERTLIPYLKSRGVARIDHLVLTHTDEDHVGDMEIIAQHFKIGEVLVSPGSLTNPEFVAKLRAMRVQVRPVKAGDSLSIMKSQLQVLYPKAVGDGGNNDSLVLYGKLLDKKFLFTGDLEEGELDLISTYPNLPVDVLKAGHHGSKGSSYPEFLKHIGADIALISAGQNNRYQHPHQETLDRFEQANMTVYRTDQQGAIRFRGLKKWTVETVRE